MSTVRLTITIERTLLKGIDSLVRDRSFPSRSSVIAAAVREKLERLDRNRLTRECVKLNPKYEQGLAEAGIERDSTKCPEY